MRREVVDLATEIRRIVNDLAAGKISKDKACQEIIDMAVNPQAAIPHRERRKWKRKETSLEGTLQIVHALQQARVSRRERVLATNISLGGLRLKAPFISLDELSVIGDLSQAAWCPNLLDIELTMPGSPPQNICLQGSAEWYLKVGTEPCYLIGVSIDIISKDDRDKLLDFLEAEGLAP
jgi:hypothetical protein